MQDDSWADVDFWVRELQYYLPRELDDGMPVLFVGNKKDLVDKRDDDQKVVNFRQVGPVSGMVDQQVRPVSGMVDQREVTV